VVMVGSRASALARTQVREVLAPLRQQLPNVDFRHRVILEGGDRDRRTPTLAEVAKTSGGSAFSSSQEAALLAGEVDMIVHSLKDLPTAMPAGLILLTTPGLRADVRDALCGHSLDSLPHGARVGTGAPRRVAQLLALRPDITLVPIRGNVGPRLARIKTGAVDARPRGCNG
jgi:hydroxymethylbilane synthase